MSYIRWKVIPFAFLALSKRTKGRSWGRWLTSMCLIYAHRDIDVNITDFARMQPRRLKLPNML